VFVPFHHNPGIALFSKALAAQELETLMIILTK
jgi:hypothetical protein